MIYKTILTIAAVATWLAAAGGQAATTLDDLVEPGVKPQVIGTGYGFCEGPTADARGNVYFSDGMKDAIHFYQPGKPVVKFVASTDANGQKISGRGELYTCEGIAHRVVAFNVQTKQKRVLCSQIDGVSFNEPNDLTIDRLGGFYFTDPYFAHRNQKAVMKEAIYYCSPQGVVTRVSTVCQKPNGVQLTPDEKTIYLADWARGGFTSATWRRRASWPTSESGSTWRKSRRPDARPAGQPLRGLRRRRHQGLLARGPVDRRHQGRLRFQSLLRRARFQDPLLHLD